MKNTYRKRHESALGYCWRMNKWFILGGIAFLLIWGIIGHIEYTDLSKYGFHN